jgi:hypothetical protein
MSTKLWQLLIKIDEMEPGGRLTCTDCFAIMDLLLLAAELGVDFARLKELAQEHLAHCPGCREKLWQQLHQLQESGWLKIDS